MKQMFAVFEIYIFYLILFRPAFNEEAITFYNCHGVIITCDFLNDFISFSEHYLIR